MQINVYIQQHGPELYYIDIPDLEIYHEFLLLTQVHEVLFALARLWKAFFKDTDPKNVFNIMY
jgi:hypothetical protein